jgi:hypothetical protein
MRKVHPPRTFAAQAFVLGNAVRQHKLDARDVVDERAVRLT